MSSYLLENFIFLSDWSENNEEVCFCLPFSEYIFYDPFGELVCNDITNRFYFFILNSFNAFTECQT